MYRCNFCNSVLVDNPPSYVPLSKDSVMEIIDQTCPKCGGVVLGPGQKKRVVKDKEFHDKVISEIEKGLHPDKIGLR